MNVGALRDYLTLQYRTFTLDDMGERVESWNHLGYVWGRVETNVADERFVASQSIPEATHRIIVRYREIDSATVRVVFRGRVYQILGAHRLDGRDDGSVLYCKDVGEPAGQVAEILTGEPVVLDGFGEVLTLG